VPPRNSSRRFTPVKPCTPLKRFTRVKPCTPLKPYTPLKRYTLLRRFILLAVALLLTLAGLWGLHRQILARTVLHHPVVRTFQAAAAEAGWTPVLDASDRPGLVEPLWLAGMMGEPYRRRLVYDTGAPASELGPKVERLLFGDGQAPPSGPVDGIVWRASRVAPSLSLDPNIEIDRDQPRGSFVGHAEEVSFFRRVRRLEVAVAGGLVAVVVEGGARRRGGDGSPHPLRITTPHDWDR
jgi:hypothetical protein